jgi:hypothetical protein
VCFLFEKTAWGLSWAGKDWAVWRDGSMVVCLTMMFPSPVFRSGAAAGSPPFFLCGQTSE